MCSLDKVVVLRTLRFSTSFVCLLVTKREWHDCNISFERAITAPGRQQTGLWAVLVRPREPNNLSRFPESSLWWSSTVKTQADRRPGSQIDRRRGRPNSSIHWRLLEILKIFFQAPKRKKTKVQNCYVERKSVKSFLEQKNSCLITIVEAISFTNNVELLPTPNFLSGGNEPTK